jgi:mRNA interferase MazF
VGGPGQATSQRPRLYAAGASSFLDAFNVSTISTVIELVITSNTNLAAAPGNVLLAAAASGLPKDSVANVSQLRTLDKTFLSNRVRRLSANLLAQVEAGLWAVLELP